MATPNSPSSPVKRRQRTAEYKQLTRCSHYSSDPGQDYNRSNSNNHSNSRIASWYLVFIFSCLMLVGGLFVTFRLNTEVCQVERAKFKKANLGLGQELRDTQNKLHKTLQEKLTALEETIEAVKERKRGDLREERLRKQLAVAKEELQTKNSELAEKNKQLKTATEEILSLRLQLM